MSRDGRCAGCSWTWSGLTAPRNAGREPAHLPLDSNIAINGPDALDLLALDVALDKLAALDVRKVRVIELRFFGGLTVEEAAHVLEVSPDTIARDWRMARSWLQRELAAGPEP